MAVKKFNPITPSRRQMTMADIVVAVLRENIEL